MDLIWLVPLILGAGFAVAGGQDAKWKSVNLLIIVGCMAVGFGIGYAAGLGSQNLGRVPDGGWPFSMMFGIVAALVCVQLNSQRAK
jgi:1,4-dihydroxy-2-naphthoate octaprenyltransferase